MEERNEMEKIDDVMPGFRFHPTDEELVGFYLKRKIQQKSLPIELIKQVDIYKHDPWDLPSKNSHGSHPHFYSISAILILLNIIINFDISAMLNSIFNLFHFVVFMHKKS